MSYEKWKKGHELCVYNSVLPELEDLNQAEPIKLKDLLAEYDVGVLKQWLSDQHAEESAQEVPSAQDQPRDSRFNLEGEV